MRVNNFKSLIKDEFVKKFEQTILDEIRNYKKSIADIEEQFSILNIKCNTLAIKQKDFFDLINNIKSDCKNHLIQEKEELFDKFESHRKYINENVDKVQHDLNSFLIKFSQFVKKDDLENEKSFIQSQLKDMYLIFEKENKKINQFIFEIKSGILRLFDELDLSLKKDFVKVNEKIEDINKKNDINKVDFDGLLKELREYKKSMFIIEKKIENIYTLIKRIGG